MQLNGTCSCTYITLNVHFAMCKNVNVAFVYVNVAFVYQVPAQNGAPCNYSQVLLYIVSLKLNTHAT